MNIETVSSVGKILKKVTARGFIKAKNIINPFASTTCDTIELLAQRSVKTFKKHSITPALKLLKTDPKIAEQIFKSDNVDEFITNARKLICKQHGIPLGLSPEFIFANELSNDLAAQYIPRSHVIQFSNKYLQLFDAGKLGKKELWGYLVHELEHARQNLQILSTPSLADKAIKTYSKNTAEIFLKYFKELPTEEIEKMIKENSTDKCVNILKKILETRKNGKEITKKLEEEAFKQFYKEAFTEWKNTQEIVKNFIEPILPNTKKEKISKKLFSEMVNIKSYNENNSFFENLKYVFQFSEMFAYFKQIYSIRNLNF